MTLATPNEYLVPASSIFESIDSVCLPFVFQMTIADKHPIKLNKFAEFLLDLDERQLAAAEMNSTATTPVLSPETLYNTEIPFVFVVPEDNMDSFQ